MGVSQGTSDRLNSFVGAVGQSMLVSDGRNPFGAVPYFMQQEQKSADAKRQRDGLKAVLRRLNPAATEAELDAMASDPATAKLAVAAAQAEAETKAGQTASGLMGGLLGGAPGSGVQMSPTAPAGPAAGASLNGPSSDASSTIPGSLTLDDNNLDLAVRTTMAEAGNEGPEGRKAVAAVLRNRALLAGTSVAQEALKKNQFEPWNPGSKNDPRRFKVESPEYQRTLAEIRPVLEGQEDPTGGATHFYAPGLQSDLGRNKPSWDDGSGVALGNHRFFRIPYAGKNPSLLAQRQAQAAPTQVAGGPGAPMPVVSSQQLGFNPSDGVDPLAGFVPSGGPGAPRAAGSEPVEIAETEEQSQAIERRMGMYPPGPASMQPPRRPNGPSEADLPAAGNVPAGLVIPPAPEAPRYGPTTMRALAARQASAAGAPGSPGQTAPPAFALNDPAQATKAIPQLFKVLSIPNLPDAQKAQAKSMLDYALSVVKPTERTRQLMEAGYTPGTPEYVAAYKSLINSDRTPSGYRFTGDGQTLEPIPGGPQDPSNRATKAPPPGYRALDGGERFEPIPGGPADPATISTQAQARAAGKPAPAPKPLPQNAVKDLAAAGESYGDFNRLVTGFRPDFAGWRINAVGDAANAIASKTGIGNTDAADWWADYAAKRNVTRNKLFGSALTASEKSEFLKADITPGMTPEAIGKNLARQQDAATRAARKLSGYYIKAGRNPEEIEAALGIGLDELGVGADASTASPEPSAQPQSAPRAGRSPAPVFSPADLEAEARRRGLMR
jgi:spore germination cell wall hydrolase CwlJ-like protein